MDTENRMLGLAGKVRMLCSAAVWETQHDEFHDYETDGGAEIYRAKAKAYSVVLGLIQESLGIESSNEFHRRINEFGVADTLGIKVDGEYGLICDEGRIVVLSGVKLFGQVGQERRKKDKAKESLGEG